MSQSSPSVIILMWSTTCSKLTRIYFTELLLPLFSPSKSGLFFALWELGVTPFFCFESWGFLIFWRRSGYRAPREARPWVGSASKNQKPSTFKAEKGGTPNSQVKKIDPVPHRKKAFRNPQSPWCITNITGTSTPKLPATLRNKYLVRILVLFLLGGGGVPVKILLIGYHTSKKENRRGYKIRTYPSTHSSVQPFINPFIQPSSTVLASFACSLV